METMISCPWCGTAKHVHLHGERDFWCARCKRLFDGIDDGDVGYGRPERYAERKEEFRQRQKARARR